MILQKGGDKMDNMDEKINVPSPRVLNLKISVDKTELDAALETAKELERVLSKINEKSSGNPET